MKRLFLLFIFLITSNNFSAHKPKVKVENFGNIKTYFISQFNFGTKTIESEELKMHIIGKLSKIISDKMGYRDTIMIERKTYLADNKNDFYILESGNSNYKVAVLDDGVLLQSNNRGLAIRIISDKVNVIDVLKLVEYTIQNKLKINDSLVSTPYFYNEDEEMKILSNSQEFISKIVNQNSKLIDEIIKEDIIVTEDSETIISWNNNEFVFRMNLEKFKSDNPYRDFLKDEFKIQDFKYYIYSSSYYFFLVFHDMETFTYFDGREENRSQKIKIETKRSWYPLVLAKDKIGNKIILYDRDQTIYIYNINKKLLQKIE
ncbi:hypothetical protein K0U91_02640 [Chryseobacterium chendengshani]|uniref:hypothetical protein n=1 Tax=Chryseobacterium sp. LJ668 TaxID=2864040 RepID=UPI001C688CD4|nr:hypothetical protein [Chryseobacterium sp. LJ668]MBW8524117.1 hypothetical protein [Chryseobacterium sp. LJ668]QYK17051.1 hypothetical protein K0U91_02640 [Chryseobacterium sp. LJ668]